MNHELGDLTPGEIKLIRQARENHGKRAERESKFEQIMAKSASALTEEETAFLRDVTDKALGGVADPFA